MSGPVFKTIEEAFNEVERIGEERETLDFDIDGAVIKVNSLSQRELETLNSIMELPQQALEQERGISHGI